jgi:hypothetical protein
MLWPDDAWLRQHHALLRELADLRRIHVELGHIQRLLRLRRRLLDQKYNANQPRVPAGNPDGGQWTSGGGGHSLGGRLGSEAARSREGEGLFRIGPDDPRPTGVRLAGDVPEGSGSNPDPPRIPTKRPDTREERMLFLRDVADWVRVVGRYAPVVSIFFEAPDQAQHIAWLTQAAKSANDPPETLEVLQQRATEDSQPGYHNHHIVGQHWQNRQKFGDGPVQSRENIVRIPVLKHIEITRWYSTQNSRYGGMTSRDYLRGREWDEQTEVGLEVLREHGVLK